MDGKFDRMNVQEAGVQAGKLPEIIDNDKLDMLQALGDALELLHRVQTHLKEQYLQSEIAPEATIWHPEEFDEINEIIQRESQPGLA